MAIDPKILKAGEDISRRAGENMRQDMLDAGMTEKEISETIKKAFAWLHKPVISDERLEEYAGQLWTATTDPYSSDASPVEDFTEAIGILRKLLKEANAIEN
jgi:hypothetical protein